MAKKHKPVLCPVCTAPIANADVATCCLHCGWLPLVEIERQLRYWEQRRETALLAEAGVVVTAP